MPSAGGEPESDPTLQLIVSELDRLYRYCYRILGNKEDAQDAMQDTAIKAIGAAVDGRAPKEPREFRPWLTFIARNACYDIIRKRHAEKYVDVEQPGDDEALDLFSILADKSPSSEQLLAWKQVVLAAFKRLNQLERMVLVRVYMDGESATDVGKELSIRWIHALIKRAKSKVVEAIRELAAAGDRNAQSLLDAYRQNGGQAHE
jgi:RNA polymerase sigma-70 factor, ECF subfamily